jgi:hypothetical protein
VTGAMPLTGSQTLQQQHSVETGGGESASTNLTAAQAVTSPQDQSQNMQVTSASARLQLRRFSGTGATGLSEVVTSPKHNPVFSPKHYARDAPTPQSVGSSSWSLQQAAVAPEVDALTTAAAAGNVPKVKALLDSGVDVNAVNTFGRTAVQVS